MCMRGDSRLPNAPEALTAAAIVAAQVAEPQVIAPGEHTRRQHAGYLPVSAASARYNSRMVKRGNTKHEKHAGHSRRAIAAQAARLMAEDGIAEFGAAKRKAARQLGFAASDALPSNDEIEAELRAYQTLFQNDEQHARVAGLREIALDLLQGFARYHPCLTGPVWKGTAGPDAAITLDLFAESTKMVEVLLIDEEIDYRTSEWPHFNRAIARKVPVLSFEHANCAVNLVVYAEDDRRGALLPDVNGEAARGEAPAVERRMAEAEAAQAAAGFLAEVR